MIELQPINKTFVADITGLDVRQLSDADFDEIYTAWPQFGVLRLRNQPVDEDELQAFSARFGHLCLTVKYLQRLPMSKPQVNDRQKQ